VVLDSASIVPELSGSEFFGHERGAFTGALTERHGAFALANDGTLFLDEIGDLPLPLQVQLLRVIQEHTYKRVGGNKWCKTEFRLICATNRDLLDLIGRGAFRADLYYRIAGYICKLPPLRERLEDVIPLAEHFLRHLCPDGKSVELDSAVREFLLRKEYPGNVRDLQQVVSQMMHHATADGRITIGCVPAHQRPVLEPDQTAWLDCSFERPIQRAVLLGAALKEIGRAAEDVAVRYATDEEEGNLHRAASRLGVTDRALQLRRAKATTVSDASMPATTKGRNAIKGLALLLMVLGLGAIATDAAA
jgi:transcriptional regulator with GAF, ATPase, and Fis domain